MDGWMDGRMGGWIDNTRLDRSSWDWHRGLPTALLHGSLLWRVQALVKYPEVLIWVLLSPSWEEDLETTSPLCPENQR